jgi:hypothetical protein
MFDPDWGELAGCLGTFLFYVVVVALGIIVAKGLLSLVGC